MANKKTVTPEENGTIEGGVGSSVSTTVDPVVEKLTADLNRESEKSSELQEELNSVNALLVKTQEELSEVKAKILAKQDELDDAYGIIKELKERLHDKSRAVSGKHPKVTIDGKEYEFKYSRFAYLGAIHTAEAAAKAGDDFLRALRDNSGMLRPLWDHK